MRKVVIQHNQGVFETALMLTGSVNGAFGLMEKYGSILPTFAPGEIVETEEMHNAAIAEVMVARKPARMLKFFDPNLTPGDFDHQDFNNQDFY